MPEIRTLSATRYVQPLREGGSLPAVVDTHGGGLFVVKFRGAGQGARALVAEVIVGLLARELDLPVPEPALIEVPAPLGASEPDPEIQDVLRSSHGLNFGLRYLDGAFNYSPPAAEELVEPRLASATVWLDALVTNPDRTYRNPNLLVHDRRPWLIDHGAALYAQHNWAAVDEARTRTPFPLIRDHVLLRRAEEVPALDEELASRLTEERLAAILATVPDEWLMDPARPPEFASAEEARARYLAYLRTRLGAPRAFVHEAVEARERLLREPPRALSARR
jgi:hypothetical protein